MIEVGRDLSEAESAWVESWGDRGAAQCCVRYARLLNTLDPTGLEEWLAPFVTYESQSVFEVLRGRPRVVEYLTGKLSTLRRSDREVAAELAGLGSSPCVALFQAVNRVHVNWLESPSVVMQIKADEDGRAISFFMITCVPTPASAQRSGIWPGRSRPPEAQPVRPVRTSAGFEKFTLVVWYLNGRTGLDLAMREAACHARDALPGLHLMEFNSDDYAGMDAKPQPFETSFVAFPAVAVVWNGCVMYAQEGLLTGDQLISEIQRVVPPVLTVLE